MLNKNWLTIEVFFYSLKQTDYLIYTLFSSVKEKFDLEQFFFVRVFNPGPCIRLRFLFEGDVQERSMIEKGILKTITTEIDKYNIDYISQEEFIKKYKINIPEHVDWKINGHIQLGEYKSEIERYGGKKSLKLAEEVFFKSSVLCINYFKKEINDFDRIRISLLLNFQIIKSLRTTPEESIRYLEGVATTWEDYTMKLNKDKINVEKLKENAKTISKNIKIEDLSIYRNEYENDWESYTNKINNFFDYICKNNCYVASTPNFSNKMTKFINDKETEGEIYKASLSLMHMNQNRLGIANPIEPMMYYLMINIVKKEHDLE